MSTTLRRGGYPAAPPSAFVPRGGRDLDLEPLEGRQMLSTVVGASASEPSADEQYMLQLVNRAAPTRRPRGSGCWPSRRLTRRSRPRSRAGTPPRSSSRSTPTARCRRWRSTPGSSRRREPTTWRWWPPTRSSTPSPALSPGPPRPTSSTDGQPYYPTGDSTWTTAENVFAYSANLADPHGKALDDFFHEAFLLDWGNPDFGHLRNLHAPRPVRRGRRRGLRHQRGRHRDHHRRSPQPRRPRPTRRSPPTPASTSAPRW